MKTGFIPTGQSKWVFGQKASDKDLKHLEKELVEARDVIVRWFLEALDNHDGERIMRIARAVWFFKDKQGFNPVDHERTLLMFVKTLTDETETRLTIREIAEFIAADDSRKTVYSQDGFSALRRKCRQLGIPLAPSRKIRKK